MPYIFLGIKIIELQFAADDMGLWASLGNDVTMKVYLHRPTDEW